MDRKDFISQVGTGVAMLLVPACMGGLSSCSKNSNDITAPTNVDFTLSVGSGALATNGGFLVSNGVIVARTTSGAFLAVSAACTHEGVTVSYVAGSNSFLCSAHGSAFSSTGSVTNGPATKALTVYKTALTGTSLRVYS